MKTTTFNEIILPVSITYDLTYMEYLEANEITYTTRTLPIFQTLLPLDTISYGGYEVAYKDEQGNPKYAYPFITEKRDFTKCVTFLPEEKLDNLFLLDLEQALRTGKLTFISDGDDSNRFKGFDFSQDIRIEELLDTIVELTDGSLYSFTSKSEFPEGIIGKKILPDGEAVNLFLAKTNDKELSFLINEQYNDFRILNYEDIVAIFGTR